MKKIIRAIATIVASSFIMTSCGGGSSSIMVKEDSTLNILVNSSFGAMYNESTFQPFIDAYKDVSGITLNIIKPLSYYQQMPILFAVGEAPDILELSGTFYPTYAENDMLWDMTDAWENSNLKKSGNIDERFIEISKIDGRLYGFPINRGIGGVTYIRKDWLDAVGLEVPKTYDEFIEVLTAFREDDPDGNGKKDTHGMTSAGLMDFYQPYDIFLREFYQDAIPDFYEKDGVYVDGMNDTAMIEALYRLKYAYENKLIDPEIITNDEESAVSKFTAGKVGVISYYPGNMMISLENDLKASNPEAELIVIEPIEGVSYYERPPVMFCITSVVENPQEVFDKLIEYSYDGGEGQTLFTLGVEDVNYFLDDSGKYRKLENPENPSYAFDRTMYTPELSVSKIPSILEFDERVSNSLDILRNNSILVGQPETNSAINEHIYYLNDIKVKYISEMLFGRMSPEEVIEKYNKDGKEMIEAILLELNN